MKALIVLAGAALTFSTLGIAAQIEPCPSGSFVDYLAIAATGCSVDGLQLSGFTLLSAPAGSTSLAASAITVNPFGPSNPGLQFGVNATAGPSQLFEAVSSFNVASLPGGSAVVGASLIQNGASATGDATVLATESFCLGGNVGATGACSGGTPGDRSLGTLTLSGLSEGVDTLTFGTPRSQLGVTVDFSVEGGSPGSASLASVNAQFVTAAIPSRVPEPATFFLSGAALLGLVAFRRSVS